MPIQVDIEQRRRAIAEATFAVAAREGIQAVTLRSVAAEMGASTTAITNYLPTRADLLVNAVDEMGREWLEELEGIRTETHGPDALRRLMRAAVAWDAGEYLRCAFWVTLLAEKGRDERIDAHLAETSTQVRSAIEEVVAECGHPRPGDAADMLFLVAQGVFVSIVESPTAWPPERVVAAADLAVNAVLGST